MTEFTGTIFDGESLRGADVSATISADGNLRLLQAGDEKIVPLAAVRVSDRIGSMPRFVHLPDGGTIETADNDALDAALSAARRGRLTALIHLLESHSRVAAAATVLLIGLVAFCLKFGLPALAAQTALKVPATIEAEAGQAALAALQPFLGGSQLNPREQRRVQRQLKRLIQNRPFEPSPKLHFCSMGPFPNAFALPGNTIVVADEFVRLAAHDDEIAAVLAHELGHLEKHHGIQSLLRNSLALLVVASVTGDLSTLTAFAGTVPFLLLQNGYSRDLEREADAYALVLMKERGINPGAFASILKKMEGAQPEKGPNFTYLSTHPATEERAGLFQPDQKLAAAAAVPAIDPEDIPLLPAVSVGTVFPLENGLPDRIRAERSVYTFPRLDKNPVAVQQVVPPFPYNLESAGTEGEVLIDLIVDRSGDVRSLHVIRSTHPEFAESVLKAAYLWKFEPGYAGFETANARLQFQVNFRFNSGAPE